MNLTSISNVAIVPLLSPPLKPYAACSSAVLSSDRWFFQQNPSLQHRVREAFPDEFEPRIGGGTTHYIVVVRKQDDDLFERRPFILEDYGEEYGDELGEASMTFVVCEHFARALWVAWLKDRFGFSDHIDHSALALAIAVFQDATRFPDIRHNEMM